MNADAPAQARLDPRDRPALTPALRQDLGRMLAAVYERDESSALPARLATLLVRLDAALADAQGREDVAFRADLLAAVPALRRFALSLARQSEEADDLVQEALMRAWRNRASFTLGTNLDAWVFTILRNNFYSGRRKKREVEDPDGAHTASLVAIAGQGDRLDLQDVQVALTKLGAPMREALLLVTVEGMSYERAAAVMGCKVGTVKSRVARARAQLVQILGYSGGELGQDSVMRSAGSAASPCAG